MQNSLWKLGALLGVIGVGFLVLLKAQNEMTDGRQPDESFSELAAIEELGDLDPAGSEQSQQADAKADEFSASPALPVGIAASSADEPQPTPAGDLSDLETASDETEAADVNPFADFAAAPTPAGQSEPTVAEQVEPTPAGWEGATQSDLAAVEGDGPTADEAHAADEPADSETVNPFGALVESFGKGSTPQPQPDQQPQPETENDATDPALQAPAVAADTPDPSGPAATSTPAQFTDTTTELGDAVSLAADAAQAAEPMLSAAAESFNPFTSADSSGTSAGDPTAAEAAPPESADDAATEIEAAPSGADGAASSIARTSLTALPPADSGPALMAPPTDVAQVAPAHLERADVETGSTDTDAGTQIAQVSGEQRAGGASDPNPFLVFPGADDPAQPQTTSPQALSEAAPTFPTGDPGTSGRAWVGDTTRIEVPPQIEPAPRSGAFPSPGADRRTAAGDSEGADNRVVLPDGTVEMTIMPRNGEPQTMRLRQDQSGDVNPFAATPPAGGQSRADSAREPAPFEAPPDVPGASAQPRFPDPGLSFSKGPIQPSAAEVPQSESPATGTGLTSADFVGVGTISPDTPSTPQQAQLTIEKQAPADAALGQELIYNILIRNIGRSDAGNVVVEDLVPKGTELQGTDPQAHMTPDKKLVWKLGTMNPGTTRTIRIKVIPREAGQIGSVATVSFEAAVASRTTITAPQLRLALNGPQEVRVGEKAPYTFTLTNSGSADASNVYIRNIIPTGFEHPAAQQRNGVTDIEYEVGMLRKGESREVELTLLAVAEGQFQNHAILSADGNVNVEAQHAVNVITSRLKIHREGPANRVVGSQARFTNTITNESNRPLQGVTVTESIPVGVKFVQASDGGSFNPQQRTIIWQISALEPGGVRQLQTVVLAEQGGQLASTVTAVDQQGDQAEATSKLNVAGYSSLTVDVTNPARAIPVGEEVALRLKVRNGGTAAANAVETRIKLPPELKFVSARGPVRYAQQGEWIAFEPIDRIDIQAEQTFDIVLAAVAESQDARVVVQLTSSELSKPLSEDESVVIYTE